MANKFGVQPFNSPVEPTMDYAKIAPLIGVQSPRHLPHDRVTEVDVDRWCQVMRDTNPLYTDEEYAKKSPWGGLLAPSGMVHVFALGTMKAAIDQFVHGKCEFPDDPNVKLNLVVEQEGYTGVMATAQRQQHFRRLRVGDEIHWTLGIARLSDYDHLTRQGVGRKYQMLYQFYNQNDELLCNQSFDVLVYRAPMSTRRLYAG